jgi:hypothetical protein
MAWANLLADSSTMPPRGDLVLGADLNCSELGRGRSPWKAACFDQAAIARWCGAVRNMREHSNQRTMVEMGLAGVAATQLWHHTDIGAVPIPRLLS